MFTEGHRFTPTEVSQHLLGLEVGEFDVQTSITQSMLKDYPRLLEAELQALKTTAGEAAPILAQAEPFNRFRKS